MAPAVKLEGARMLGPQSVAWPQSKLWAFDDDAMTVQPVGKRVPNEDAIEKAPFMFVVFDVFEVQINANRPCFPELPLSSIF